MESFDIDLTNEQILMRDVCRKFVNEEVTPFIIKNWVQEWSMSPDGRLPKSILEKADQIGIRTFGIPEKFGGTSLELTSEVRTFALISEEIAINASAPRSPLPTKPLKLPSPGR